MNRIKNEFNEEWMNWRINWMKNKLNDKLMINELNEECYF